MPNKASNIKQQKETTGNGQRKEEEPEWKSQSIVIVNSKARTTKPITSDILVQEQKLKLKRGGKEDNINSCLRKSSDINDTDICPLCNRLVRTGGECGICCIWFHYRCEGTTKERKVEKYPQETYYICKKTRNKINYKYKLEGSGNSYKKKRKPEHKKRQIQKFAEYS